MTNKQSDNNKITLSFRTLTPMFLAGADGKNPELRIPSVKGVLRYWWRALNGHLQLSTVQKREGLIFGSQEYQSPLFMHIANVANAEKINANLLPKKNFTEEAFKPGLQFQVNCQLYTEELTKEQITSLLVVATTLGGFGKRMRRGMGSVALTHIGDEHFALSAEGFMEELLSHISAFNRFYELSDNAILFKHNGSKAKLPWIDRIEAGPPIKNIDSFLMKVSKATSDMKHRYGKDYDAAMGHARGGRFASPVVVSIARASNGEYMPVVTTLNTLSNRKSSTFPWDIQREFKQKILV